MAAPTLLWFRRDLRLGDHPALHSATQRGLVIPVFIRDESIDGLGSAPKWRLGQALDQFDSDLRDKGSRLTFRSGPALTALRSLISETGARAVYWTRAYDPTAMTRDAEIKSVLKQEGIEAKSFGGHLLFEPWQVETKTGSFYKVYTPFWKAVRNRDVDAARAAPFSLPSPETWPVAEALESWSLGASMHRGAPVVARYARIGERAARQRLEQFIAQKVEDYEHDRNLPARDATSGLSENLSLGEIGPNECWHLGRAALEAGNAGAETFLKELVWREFAYHLLYHTPRILTENWKPDWDQFPWNTDETAHVTAWKRARTGIPFVDAGLREMYVTGKMHNRARMIVGSYLTKHLLTHWTIGRDWFEDCLTDWDPASNAMGWQWVAGSGPDASPYFRIFNPLTQREKFDPDCAYVDRWIAEGKTNPHPDALRYFEAIPEHWNMSPDAHYPAPVVGLEEGRHRALASYQSYKG